MAHPFDATLKKLLEESPADWPALIGHPAKSVEVIDADIATVSGAADRVLRVHDVEDWIMHVEFQTSTDALLPRRMNVYNSVLEHRHNLPVRSVAILLSRDANLTAINGLYERTAPGETEPYRSFRYEVIRVWELPPERFLQGGPSLLPLAPISAVKESELPAIVHRLKERLQRMTEPDERNVLASATFILMGLRFDPIIARRLLEGIGMKESSTYRAIVEEGREIGEREGLLRGIRQSIFDIGERHFASPPNPHARETLESIESPERLRSILNHLLQTHSWEELLNTPS